MYRTAKRRTKCTLCTMYEMYKTVATQNGTEINWKMVGFEAIPENSERWS